jgi:hypothetical protein
LSTSSVQLAQSFAWSGLTPVTQQWVFDGEKSFRGLLDNIANDRKKWVLDFKRKKKAVISCCC